MRGRAALLAAGLMAQAPAPEYSPDRARASLRARADAAEAASDAAEQRRIAATAALQQAEAATAALIAHTEALADRRDAAATAIAARVTAMAVLLPLSQRQQASPEAMLLAAPESPSDAVRAATILSAMARAMAAEAGALEGERAQIDAMTRELEAAAPALRAAAARQAELSMAMDTAAAVARALRDGTEADFVAYAARADAAGRHAGTLHALADGVGANGPANPASGAASMPLGALLLSPTPGKIIKRFGEPTDAGPSTGLLMRPPPNGRLLAPCGGRVVYAAPFRSYGLLLIVDCGGGTHVVLSGLDRLDTQAGAIVRTGDAVGAMAPAPRPVLYFEVRRQGRPVDPAPLLNGPGTIVPAVASG